MEKEKSIKSVLNDICEALKEAGYDPKEQLAAYSITNDLRYITRSHNARVLISKIPPEEIERHLKEEFGIDKDT